MIHTKPTIQSTILESFKNTNLTLADFQEFTPQVNEDGSYDIPFSVTTVGDNFDFKNECIAATSADVSFEVTLTGCIYDAVNGWQWGRHCNYIPKGGVFKPSVILYNKGEASNDPNEKNCYAAGMTKEEDAELGKKLTTIVMQNVAERCRVAFFKKMLAAISAPE